MNRKSVIVASMALLGAQASMFDDDVMSTGSTRKHQIINAPFQKTCRKCGKKFDNRGKLCVECFEDTKPKDNIQPNDNKDGVCLDHNRG